MLSLALISGWYYICTSYYTPDNFNIRDNNWNLVYSHYFTHTDILIEITNFFNLRFFILVNYIFTQYADNPNDSNSVIYLIFL